MLHFVKTDDALTIIISKTNTSSSQWRQIKRCDNRDILVLFIFLFGKNECDMYTAATVDRSLMMMTIVTMVVATGEGVLFNPR